MFIILIIYFSIVRMSSTDQNITVDIGHDITFSCFFETPSQIEQVSFMHQSTGDILSLGLELFLDESLSNKRMKLIPFSSHRLDLKILSVNQNDSGLYTCMFNDETLSSFLLEIFVPPRFLSFAPLEASVSYPEGSAMNLSCRADASPPANVTWIYRNRNKRFQTIQSGEEVYIPAVEPFDSGSYECIASNGHHATISRSFYVTIQYPPRVKIDKFIDLTRRPVHFQCEICSVPFSHVEWLKNGQNLVNEQHIVIQTDSVIVEKKDCLISTLTVQDSRHETSGRYECRAENFLGHHSDHIDYQIKTIPQPKSGKEQFALLTLPNNTNNLSNSYPSLSSRRHVFVLSISLLIIKLLSIL